MMTIPFLNWAGGKRWLAPHVPSLFSQKYNRYIEPFLGSAAIYFSTNPDAAILGDLNRDLIESYMAIKLDWKQVNSCLKLHHKKHSKEYYYKVRGSKPRSLFSRAAKFIYLNRTCWNGLYRVNLKGEFNVPIGTKKNVILESDNFEKTSNLLQNAELMIGDFELVIDRAEEGDLLFVDPPYTVKHNFNNFIKYNEKLFSWNDQVRLRNCLLDAKGRGVHLVSTNALHPSIKELYENFDCREISRKSLIAANPKNRNAIQELIILG